MRGIHRSPVKSPYKGQWRGAFFFFYLNLNERLSKHLSGWWFETPSRPLWRHSNEDSCLAVARPGLVVAIHWGILPCYLNNTPDHSRSLTRARALMNRIMQYSMPQPNHLRYQWSTLICDIIGCISELILGLRQSNERRRYKVTPSLIGLRPRISPVYIFLKTVILYNNIWIMRAYFWRNASPILPFQR